MTKRHWTHAAGPMAMLYLATVMGVASQTCPVIPTGNAASSPALPNYEVGNYSVFNPPYDTYGNLVYPFGPDGIADIMAQQAEFLNARIQNIQGFLGVVQGQLAACGALENALSPNSDCITSLEDFQKMYDALPEDYRPTLSNFSDSDAAFARMRITVGPMLLEAVTDSLPFDASTIAGLNDIIADTEMTLDQLIAANRVFMIDTAPLADILEPAPGAVVEFPTVVLFVDGPDAATGQIMPLAIKFNVYNNNTYSPKDSRADWLLAKAFYNSLDTSIHAAVHFMNNHFVLENICLANQRFISTTHPLYELINKPCNRNGGVIADGIEILLPAETGLFDNLLAIAGQSVAKALPTLLESYDWEGNYLDNWVADRGLSSIPNFGYKEDTGALYDALYKYAGTIINATYKDAATIASDTQLQTFLGFLTSGKPGDIPGFPKPAAIDSPAALTRLVAQIMWVAGAQHHALNTLKVQNYDAVYPASPGRIWAAPPAKKGVLTEQELMDKYILPTKVPMNYAWATIRDTTPPGFAPYVTDDMRPKIDPAIVSALNSLQTAGAAYGLDPNAATRVQFLLLSELLGVNFAFQKIEEDMWPAAYGNIPPSSCPGGQASETLLEDLKALSEKIQKREAALLGKLPQFTMLDPARLPYFTLT